MTRYIVKIEKEPNSDELFLTFPDELIKSLDWREGDVIQWVSNNDGSWSLIKEDKKVDNIVFDTEINDKDIGC